jgi:uncharacterized surface protein with fasciclin (FAS1) repeats
MAAYQRSNVVRDTIKQLHFLEWTHFGAKLMRTLSYHIVSQDQEAKDAFAEGAETIKQVRGKP